MNRSAPAALIVTLALAPAASAQELYRQDPIDSFGGLSSQDARNPGGLGWFSEVADNFQGQTGWSIGQVEFWGGYATGPRDPGNTEGFTVRFYTDNAGSPGTRVYEQDVAQFIETEYYVSPPLPPNFPDGLAGYHYELDLPTPFAVTTDGQYWVSIVAILARGGGADEPQWGWVQAVAASPPFAHQWFFSPGNFTEQSNDVAFVLAEAEAGCPVDLNGDGAVTIQDFLMFLSLYAAGDARADFTGDGTITVQDFLAFLSAYAAGC